MQQLDPGILIVFPGLLFPPPLQRRPAVISSPIITYLTNICTSLTMLSVIAQIVPTDGAVYVQTSTQHNCSANNRGSRRGKMTLVRCVNDIIGIRECIGCKRGLHGRNQCICRPYIVFRDLGLRRECCCRRYRSSTKDLSCRRGSPCTSRFITVVQSLPPSIVTL